MTEAAKCNRCGKPITFGGKDENDKWIINEPDGKTRHNCQQRQGGGSRPMRTEGELHDLRRESALKSAVAYVVGRMQAVGPDFAQGVKTKDVIDVAEAFAAFIEKGRP